LKYKFGIKWKLFVSFGVFSLFVITLLWVLQVVFLDDIYKTIRIRSIRETAASFEGMSDSQYEVYVKKQAVDRGHCITIYDKELNLVASEHAGGQCMVHNFSRSVVRSLYNGTASFEKKSFENYISSAEINDLIHNSHQSEEFFDHFFPPSEGEENFEGKDVAYDCVLKCQIVSNSKGEERFVLLSSLIIPLNTTIETIRFELMIISIALLLVSIAMAYILSLTISEPIIALNQASKSLSEGVFRDKTVFGYREVEELSQTLSEAADEISKVDRLRKELIANVSHDLRTPLTLIEGYSEAMRDLPGENTPENLQIVIDEAHRLSELVSDLLDLSRLEAQIQNNRFRKVDLLCLVEEILLRYRKMTRLDGYTLQLFSDLETAWVMADRVQIMQVLYNLINNAINYCGEDRTVLVRITMEKNQICVRVIDHGEGIPKDQLPEIWERYYRMDKTHKSEKVGTGLGLSIVKKVLELHGADYGVESTLGKGSCFWFSLPTAPLDE